MSENPSAKDADVHDGTNLSFHLSGMIADHRRNLGRVGKIETLPILQICPRSSRLRAVPLFSYSPSRAERKKQAARKLAARKLLSGRKAKKKGTTDKASAFDLSRPSDFMSVVPFFSPFAQTTAFVLPTFARPVFFAPLSTDHKKTKGLLVIYCSSQTIGDIYDFEFSLVGKIWDGQGKSKIPDHLGFSAPPSG